MAFIGVFCLSFVNFVSFVVIKTIQKTPWMRGDCDEQNVTIAENTS